MTASENLKKLNIDLPEAPSPVGAYVAFKKAGKLIFISGQLPMSKDGNLLKGKIGRITTINTFRSRGRASTSQSRV